jgi:hypothetical protein
MSSIGAAPRAVPLSPARAEASRRNGAKSCGPKTPEGKARSAQNALKHGLRAQKHVVLPGENAAEFEALETALLEELAPEGALQTVLARRVVAATWRLERAERLEAELFAENHSAGRSLGLALIRECNGARSFDTLLRYRGGTLAELWRALRTLKALQAEAEARVPAAPDLAPGKARASLIQIASDREAGEMPPPARPIEPESRGNPRDSGRPSRRADPTGDPAPAPALPHRPLPGSAPRARPIEPTRGQPAASVPPIPSEIVQGGGSASLLAGTALVPLAGRR